MTRVGPITSLINNAGVVFGGEFEQVELDQHLNTFRVNSEGLMATTHAFLDDLIQAKEAYLVNIASASAFIGLPYGSTYAASKWAVVGFSESLRLELAVRKIRHVHVTSVCPSYISTGMFDGVKTPLFSPMLTPKKVVEKHHPRHAKKGRFRDRAAHGQIRRADEGHPAPGHLGRSGPSHRRVYLHV